MTSMDLGSLLSDLVAAKKHMREKGIYTVFLSDFDAVAHPYGTYIPTFLPRTFYQCHTTCSFDQCIICVASSSHCSYELQERRMHLSRE